MDDWQQVSVTLAYRLGELTLFAVRFTGMAERTHFTRTEVLQQLPDPGRCPARRGELVFYPTYPIAFEPPVFSLAGSWVAYTPATFRNYFIDLARFASFEAYLQGFSAKSRSTLRRKVKKFTEASGGSLCWREFSTPEDMPEFLALGRAVSATSYQERLLKSGLPASDAFAAELDVQAGTGGVLGYVLFLAGAPVAYVLCYCRDGVATYDYVGYDPKVRELSAGTVLQYLILQSLFERRTISIFDFTEGEGEQKVFFGTDHRVCAKTYFLPRTARNVALLRAHYEMNRAVESVGRALDRVGLKTQVRKLMRRAA